jgi:hypothetical protein
MIARQSMLQFIATRDLKLMRKVNKWPAPRWIRRVAIAATRAGDGWLWYLTGLSILLLGGAERLTAVASAGSAALLGDFAPARSVLVPIGPHHHRVCGSHRARRILSRAAAGPARMRYRDRYLAHPAGHALSERCGGRRATGRRTSAQQPFFFYLKPVKRERYENIYNGVAGLGVDSTSPAATGCPSKSPPCRQ